MKNKTFSSFSKKDFETLDQLFNLLTEIDNIDIFNIIILLKTTSILSEIFIKKCKEIDFYSDFDKKNHDLLVCCLKKISFDLLDFGRQFDKSFLKKGGNI